MRSDWVSIMLTAVKMFLLALKHSGSFSKKKDALLGLSLYSEKAQDFSSDRQTTH